MVRSARTASGRPRRSNRYTNNRHTTGARYIDLEDPNMREYFAKRKGVA